MCKLDWQIQYYLGQTFQISSSTEFSVNPYIMSKFRDIHVISDLIWDQT